ncbi:LCP family protein required for cell wall assembly [Metabacillus crassostreae]|uniref:LCP family protein n=1 Tax=Metabacillus crassostreae TaxID=929098 RepID=UPI0019592BE1|nr:LCP family protein [Metabacillus crassostreae]MBM7606601.1 LCP family protein required for cell wall assembly [Metabacillus crassostreae]
MDEKELKNSLIWAKDDDELEFTSEDRKKVFNRIADNNKVKQQKRKPFLKNHMVPTLSLILLLIVFTSILLPTILTGNKNQNAESITETIVNQNQEVFSILLMGIDAYNRSDANVLLTYNRENETVKLTSIPRDAYVSIIDKAGKEMKKDKFTHAYTYGGVDSAVETVANLMNIPVDYYAVVNMDGFISIIDSLGGISYQLNESVSLTKGDGRTQKIEKGTHQFNGEEMLALLRERFSLSDGSIGREKEHARFVNSVISEAKGGISLQQIKDLSQYVDTNMPLDTLYSVISKSDIYSIHTLDLTESSEGINMEGQYYLELNSSIVDNVSNEFSTHMDEN